MRLLLDTHAFLWWIGDVERLSQKARRQIATPRNEICVSAVSILEIAVKRSAKRFAPETQLERFIPEQLARNGFEGLPVSISHALAMDKLPNHHTDPFDRLLVAQAMVERLVLVTGDRQIKKYPVRTIW